MAVAVAAVMLVVAQWSAPLSAGRGPQPGGTDPVTVRTAAVPVAPAQQPVDIASDEVDAEAHYEIVIDQIDDEIDVETSLDITFRKPNQRIGNVVYEYFLTDWFLILPASATGLDVSDPSGPLEFTVEASEVSGLSVVVIGLRRNLFNGRSADLTINYSLPSSPPPVDLSESYGLLLEEQVVVNDATAGWSFFSDPGLDSWTATINLPPGFEEVGLGDGSVTWADGVSETDPTVRTLEASGESFLYDFVVVENDSAMLETLVPLDGNEITVRYWPGDEPWRDRVVEQISENLPVLVELVDRPWPSRSLVVQESAETLGTTYGGWYTSREHLITIGPSVDANLILHELAHVWFNFEAFDDRWLIEGLAEEFAMLAANSSGEADPQADGGLDSSTDATSLTSPYATPLRSWGWQDLGADYTEEEWEEATEREAWGYRASWHTVRRTREIIGLDAFTDVISAALKGRRSYPGPGDGSNLDDGDAVEGNGGPPWEEFLDLASEHGPDDELAELYADWVEGGTTERFEARSTQRQRFQAVSDQLDGWTLPEAVRRPMRAWRFDDAAAAIDVTERFADGRDEWVAVLTPVGLGLPLDVADRLATIDQVDGIEDYERELATAVDTIVMLETRADGISVIEQVGLIGSGFDDHRAEATAGYLAGDFALAASSVDESRELLDAASSRGRNRLISGLGVLVAAVGVGVGVRWRRRRHRGSAGTVGEIARSDVEPASEEVV